MFIVAFAVVKYVMPLGYAFFNIQHSSNTNIKVQLTWQGKALNCHSLFTSDNNNQKWAIEQFQFFISDIAVASSNLHWQNVDLTVNSSQANNTVLVGTNCQSSRSSKQLESNNNWTINFDSPLPNNDIQTLRFTLGVPFSVNHLNPISQKSPLNMPSMFWVWQTGHKFMRLELKSKNEQWLFHLGSVGCHSASVMRAPSQPCRYPNTFTFEVPVDAEKGNELVLNIDLSKLLTSVELEQTTSCQSQPDNPHCQLLISNLTNAQQRIQRQNSRLFSLSKAVTIGKTFDAK